jgi:hypothetical protein
VKEPDTQEILRRLRMFRIVVLVFGVMALLAGLMVVPDAVAISYAVIAGISLALLSIWQGEQALRQGQDLDVTRGRRVVRLLAAALVLGLVGILIGELRS